MGDTYLEDLYRKAQRAERAERERDEARRAAEWWRDCARDADESGLPDDWSLPWERGEGDLDA